MNVWDRPLFAGKTDRYSVTINDKWLAGETIVNASITSEDSPDNITFSNQMITDGNTVSVLITGVIMGYHNVHFTYNTATRSSCHSSVVHVDDNC